MLDRWEKFEPIWQSSVIAVYWTLALMIVLVS